MKFCIYNIVSASLVFLLLSTAAAAAGKKKDKNSSRPLTIEVFSTGGGELKDYSVSSAKNRIVYSPDDEGKVLAKFSLGDVLKVKSEGYKTRIVDITSFPDDRLLKVTLEDGVIQEDEDHIIYTVDGGSISELRTVGAYSKVKGEDLEMYPSLYLLDALSGRLNGLYYRKTNTEPGGNDWSGFVRASDGGTPVVMIDGVVRSLDYLEPETVESVQLLKDASLKSLYGGVRTNGILMVKTKRGKPFENGVRVNVQSGVELPTALPDYLNARDYTTLYNQALVNAGLQSKYDPSLYDGSKPLQYPDVDYYDTLLKDYMTITRANAQFSGGGRNTRYFLNLGFQNEKGLEKYADNPYSDKTITVRGNVDNRLFDFITLKVGINAALQNRKWPNTNSTTFFGLLSDVRPNEFPLTIPGSMVGSDEEYELGGLSTRMNNPLGAITRNGYVHREYSYIQSDFTADFDFDKWVKGLRITPSVTFDIYNYYSSRKDGGFSVIEPVAFDEDGNVTDFKRWGYDNVVTSQVEGVTTGNRNWHFRTTANYDRNFGSRHKVSGVLMYFMQQRTFNGEIHSVRRMNIAAQGNYMLDGKYIIDASANYVGVPSFAKKNRFGLFPTVGLAWIASREDFLSSVDWLDYLKLRASYGVLGSTLYNSLGVVANYYYRDSYSIGSSYGQFNSFNNIISISQVGNPDLSFQKSKELNAGFDFEVLDRSLTGSVGAFYNYFTGGIANSADVTPGVVGKSSALKFDNIKESSSKGIEGEMSYRKKLGDFSFRVGGNFTLSRSKMEKEIDVDYPESLRGLSKVLTVGDVKGYKVIGTFSDQADIDSSPVQSFVGKVYPGDFKYRDTNGDGYVNAADRRVIANTTPSLQYGINLSFKYKGVNLDVLGYGLGGFDTMLTNKYYQIYGGRKYSSVVNDGLPNGNPHPVLRAENNQNNFVDSDYWVVNAGFFKIRNVEIGYTLPDKLSTKAGVNSVKLYVRGSNLLTISKIKDLDPECLSAGLTQYPLMMGFTGGLSFKF